jgi:hypothetical protein
MSTTDGPLVPARHPVHWSSRGSGAPGSYAGDRATAGGPGSGVRRRWCCITAAGLAVAVALCLSWVPATRITSGGVAVSSGMIRLTALIRYAGTSEGDEGYPQALVLRRQALPSGRPAGPGRDDIRTVAVRKPMAARRVRSQCRGCFAGETAERMPGLDAAYRDSADGAAAGWRPGPGAWGRQRPEMFRRNPVPSVKSGPSGRSAGPGAPYRGCRTCAAAGANGGHLGSGDRASLPGRSTRYRVIWLVCAHCGTRVAWLFFDERDIPLCANPPHSQMELQR